MGPCRSIRYSKTLPSGVLITIDQPWADEDAQRLAAQHAREVWPDGKRLADNFMQWCASEYAQGRLVPLLALRQDSRRGYLIGYNILGYSVNPLTGESMLGDWALYVAPEYRRDGIALELLEAQKKVAQELGVRECYAGYVSCDAEGMHRLYEGAGFKKSMIGFTWRISNG